MLRGRLPLLGGALTLPNNRNSEDIHDGALASPYSE